MIWSIAAPAAKQLIANADNHDSLFAQHNKFQAAAYATRLDNVPRIKSHL
jgi:hypothetical protein